MANAAAAQSIIASHQPILICRELTTQKWGTITANYRRAGEQATLIASGIGSQNLSEDTVIGWLLDLANYAFEINARFSEGTNRKPRWYDALIQTTDTPVSVARDFPAVTPAKLWQRLGGKDLTVAHALAHGTEGYPELLTALCWNTFVVMHAASDNPQAMNELLQKHPAPAHPPKSSVLSAKEKKAWLQQAMLQKLQEFQSLLPEAQEGVEKAPKHADVGISMPDGRRLTAEQWLSMHQRNQQNQQSRTVTADTAARIDITNDQSSQVNVEDPSKLVSLRLEGWPHLRDLPAGLDLQELRLVNCPSLEKLPADLRMSWGPLILRDTSLIAEIPAGVTGVEGLDASGCPALRNLPDTLEIFQWVDIADSGFIERPDWAAKRFEGLELRWRGVVIDPREAWKPNEITAEEVLAEQNAERRRILMQRMGLDRFFEEAKADELDRDTDPSGNQRRLLRIQIDGDEPLVAVSVSCPSTMRPYILRVPPIIKTCHDAVAWTAGFEIGETDKYAVEAES